MALDNVKREFASPANRFRFAPFWFLNHDLNEAETRWQVREMNEHGVGGFILHARHGLITPYMGEDWMNNLAAAIDEGKKLGMKAYLYDENNWPSGSADGRVFQDNPEFRASVCYLSQEFDVSRGRVEREIEAGDGLIAVVAVPLADGELVDFPENCLNLADYIDSNRLDWRADGDYRVFVFAREWYSKGPGRFFGSYVDTLSAAAIAKFIELTHVPYAERFSEEFGATVDGIFTDEPGMLPHRWDALIWTPKLPGEFESRTGYPLLTALPAMFQDVGPHTAKIRCDCWRTLTDLFATNYMKQIYDFCDAHKLNSIGHTLGDGELLWGARCVGDHFQVGQWLHWGGCDYLGSRTWPEPATLVRPEVGNNIAAVKFASSTAHLLGKPVVMNECFGLGQQWAVDLRTLKGMSDFVIALGTNLLEPHAFYYSIQGFRKWECPPGEFYQSPFWPYYRTLSDYVGRLSALFRDGQHIADVAFFYPMKSMWAEMDPHDNDETMRLNQSFDQLMRLLLKLNYDYDVVSEEMLQEATFADGEIIINGPDGEPTESFKVLVMPAVTTIGTETLRALYQWTQAGGKIIALGALPTKLVEDGEHPFPREILERVFGDDYELSLTVADAKKPVLTTHDLSTGPSGVLVGAPLWIDDEEMLGPLGEVLDALIEPDVKVTDSDGSRISDIVHYHYYRELRHFLLLQNTSQERSYDCTVFVDAPGDVSIWDAESGETRPALVVRGTEDGLHIPVSLPPVGATVLMIEPLAECPSTPLIDADVKIVEVTNKEAVGLVSQPGSYSVTVGSDDEPPRVIRARVRSVPAAIELADTWEFATDQPNALPLVDWNYQMTAGITDPNLANAQRIFTATFQAEIVPEEARMLLDGLKTDKVWHNTHVRDHEIFVNDQPVGDCEPGQYLDHYIYEADLTGLLRRGKNEVKIVSAPFYFFEPATVYHPVIITGRFALAGRSRPRLVAEPGQITTGPWDKQGYPYYSGIATYRQQFKVTAAQKATQLHLEMAQPGDLAEVIVNGKNCGVRAWEPFAWDISAAVKAGQNELVIKVANSMQNILMQKPKPSGLLGPVRICPHKTVRFKLS